MKRIVMHVGLGKTGTTTIQATLSANRTALNGLGIAYPGNDEAHHDLISEIHQIGAEHFWFTNRGVTAVEASTAGARLWDLILQETAKGMPTILLSSEYFQSLRTDMWQRLDQRTEALGYRLEVLCYLREPVSHIASRAQQSVKMGYTTLTEAFADVYRPWGHRAIRPAAHALGKDRVLVHRMEDIGDLGPTRHLLDAIGCAPPDAGFNDARLNTALCRDAVYLMDAINRRDDESRSLLRRHYLDVQNLDGPKFALPPSVARRMADESRPEQRWLARHFGVSYPPPEIPDAPEASVYVAEAEIRLDTLTRKYRALPNWLRRLRARLG